MIAAAIIMLLLLHGASMQQSDCVTTPFSKAEIYSTNHTLRPRLNWAVSRRVWESTKKCTMSEQAGETSVAPTLSATVSDLPAVINIPVSFFLPLIFLKGKDANTRLRDDSPSFSLSEAGG